MSGTNQSLLINTLRYLSLVNENNRPNPELDLLVNAEGTERQKLWRQILAKAYPWLINSEFNLERATTEEVHAAIRNQGVSSPDTMRKCVTFFSRAAKDAGIKFSPHVKPYAGTRPSTRAARSRIKAADDSPVDAALPTDGIKGGGESYLQLLLSKVPDFDPKWTKGEIDNWFLAIAKLDQIIRDTVGVNGPPSDDAMGNVK